MFNKCLKCSMLFIFYVKLHRQRKYVCFCCINYFMRLFNVRNTNTLVVDIHRRNYIDVGNADKRKRIDSRSTCSYWNNFYRRSQWSTSARSRSFHRHSASLTQQPNDTCVLFRINKFMRLVNYRKYRGSTISKLCWDKISCYVNKQDSLVLM